MTLDPFATLTPSKNEGRTALTYLAVGNYGGRGNKDSGPPQSFSTVGVRIAFSDLSTDMIAYHKRRCHNGAFRARFRIRMVEIHKSRLVIRSPDLPFRDLGGTPEDMNMKMEVESALRITETGKRNPKKFADREPDVLTQKVGSA